MGDGPTLDYQTPFAPRSWRERISLPCVVTTCALFAAAICLVVLGTFLTDFHIAKSSAFETCLEFALG
jgi:hypothetical protein